ncbi:MAG: sulfatase-like hydrolase/transferase [Candidatus Omnitrophica bacterium]|nr:sulfatase-like hydrolase/transferase [Candidatus Omnitrophota bacterium]
MFPRALSPWWQAAVLSALVAVISACSGKEKTNSVFTGKNVLLVSIDTCRADYVQPYGDDKAKTPVLAALAQDGIWFADAVTPVPLTMPAHATLLTGLHPIQHGVRDNFNYLLNDNALTLAELFAESGYATAGVIGSIVLSRRSGLGQGFAWFDDRFAREDYESFQPVVERKAARVVDSATGWLETWLEAGQAQPFFLFAHFFDPHMLYNPPPPFDEEYRHDLYAGEIAYVDHCLGQLIGYLKSKNLYDNLLIVVVGDHGEGLGDHQEHTHGLFLYEEAVRVPLIVKLPRQEVRQIGIRCGQSASLEDVFPTLADLCGLGPAETNGISLAPWLLDNAPIRPRQVTLETMYPLTYNWSPLYALRDREWKYIHAPQPELYQLATDPGERINLLNTATAPLREMQDTLETRLIALAQSKTHMASQLITPDRMEVLHALGYAAGGVVPGTLGPNTPLPDPKSKISVYLRNDQGLAAMAKGFTPQAIDIFKEAIFEDPNNPTSYFNLGIAYSQLERWDEAVQYTQKALELSPQSHLIHIQLARVFQMAGQKDKARTLLKAIIQDNPQAAEAHYQLGIMALQDNRFEDAIRHFEDTRRWMPDFPGIDEDILAVQESRPEDVGVK